MLLGDLVSPQDLAKVLKLECPLDLLGLISLKNIIYHYEKVLL